MFITSWIFIRFTAILVNEFTFISSSFFPKIESINLQVCALYQFLQYVRKIHQSPHSPLWVKKKNEEIKSLNAHILQMASASFAVRPTLPGRQL